MKNRLLSIDVMRGMTIFFMIVVNTPGTWTYVYAPLRHAKWHGCTPTDLVFPFFLFIVGVSMAISLNKYASKTQKESGARSQLIKKILRRTILIFLVGLCLNWFPFYHKNIGDLRILGVLQRIALAYGGAGILVVLLKDKMKLAIAASLLLFGYWGLIAFTGNGDPYSLEGNLATWFDPLVLGESHVYGGFGIPFDPEGLVSTIPGIAHVLIGYFIGLILLRLHKDGSSQLSYTGASKNILLTGVVLSVLGVIWNAGFPINKPIWTSSYVLLTCGLGTILLAALMWIIDIKKWVKWTYIFRVFGLNPLVSYALSGVFVKLMITTFKWDKTNAYAWTYESIFQPVFGNFAGSFVFALTYTMFIWFFAWLLFRKGKIIKL